MLKVSERYIVEIDISENGEARMQVVAPNKSGYMYECLNTFTGKEAIELHNKLTKKEND